MSADSLFQIAIFANSENYPVSPEVPLQLDDFERGQERGKGVSPGHTSIGKGSVPAIRQSALDTWPVASDTVGTMARKLRIQWPILRELAGSTFLWGTGRNAVNRKLSARYGCPHSLRCDVFQSVGLTPSEIRQ